MRRYLEMLFSSYVGFAAAIVYTTVSVPLALHYLSRPEFGMWALMVQIGGYFTLIDLGMKSSVGRFLIDHKDNPETGEYGSVLQTGQMVLLLQGAIVTIAGYTLSPFIAQLLGIPVALQHSFVILMRWQSVLLGVGLATEMLVQLLHSHQRSDVMNYAQPFVYLISICVLWLALRLGTGVYSVIWANAATLVSGRIVLGVACWKLHLFPPHGARGQASWFRFKELFGFGKDIFLIALGGQLMSASQTIVITRTLGLEVVAIWSVGTKAFTLLWQLTRKILDFSAPAIAEMVVRKEYALLRSRFRGLMTLSASVSGLTGVLVTVCNAPFVAVWTHGRIRWETNCDLLLGVWLVVLIIQHGHVSLVGLTKEIHFMRWIFFIEGIVFVGLAALTARWGGLAGIILCSIICTIGITGAYGIWRTSEYFAVPMIDPAWKWLKPLGQMFLGLVPSAIAVWWFTEPFTEWLQIVIRGSVLTCLGSFLLLRYGVAPELRQELIRRLPKLLKPWLRMIAGKPTDQDRST